MTATSSADGTPPPRDLRSLRAAVMQAVEMYGSMRSALALRPSLSNMSKTDEARAKVRRAIDALIAACRAAGQPG